VLHALHCPLRRAVQGLQHKAGTVSENQGSCSVSACLYTHRTFDRSVSHKRKVFLFVFFSFGHDQAGCPGSVCLFVTQGSQGRPHTLTSTPHVTCAL